MESNDSQQKESEGKEADSAAGNGVEAEVYGKVPHSSGGASLPPTTGPLGDKEAASFLDHTLLGQQQQQHSSNNKVSQSQATPIAPQATPTIPLATPTTSNSNNIISSNSTYYYSTASPRQLQTNSSIWRNSFHSLLHRHTQADPRAYLPGLKRQLYGLPSMVQRLALERQLEEHEGCVNCINFSWAGQLLASGSDDLKVVLWDWASGRVVGKFESGHVANVFQAKFMPHSDDSVLVTAARDGQVKCHVLTSTGELHHSKRVGHHNDSAHKLSVQPESPHLLLSCGEDGSVLQIDLREADERNKILVVKNEKNHKVALYSIFIDPSDANYFAVSGRDQWARIYDARLLRQEGESRYSPVKKYCPHHLMRPDNEMKRSNITCLVYSHDGKELLCSYNDEDIYLFDTKHSTEADSIHKYSGHRNSATVKGVNFFGLESEYVVSGSDCGNVFLWDKQTEKVVQYMEGDHEGVVNCLEPHPHIPVLATSGLDHDVKIFSPHAAKPTNLDGLAEVMEHNQSNRRDAWDASPSDGYEVIMEFIMRQYRRGLRERIGIQEDEDSDDSFMDTPPNEGEDDADDDNGDGREGGARRCIQQ